MKVPTRKRRLPNKLFKDRTKARDLASTILDQVRYSGSSDHKNAPNELLRDKKAPSPRPDASLCPKDINNQEEVTGWLREALEKGVVSERWEGQYPRYVWFYHRKRNEFFIGRLVNRGNGEYKGFPVTESECPKGTRKLYEPD